MEEKALTVVQQNSIIRSFDDAERAAKAMAASGFFQDSRQAAQALVKVLAGQELGFGPFASMTGVSVIQGKPVVGANLMAAAVKKTGKYNYRVIEMSDKAVELEFYEAGKPAGKSLFTMEDAQSAGLTGKDNWRKWPRNMLFARALSNGVRWYAPDIFNGAAVYTPDEMGAVEDADGNVITAQEVDVTTETHAPPTSKPAEYNQYVYEDGSAVSDKPAERQAYNDYVAAHMGKAPQNVFNLRQWVAKQKAATADQAAQSEMSEPPAQPETAES